MTDLRQAAQQALDAWDDPAGMKDLCVAMDAIRTAPQQQAEPVAELQKRYLESEKAFQQQAEPVADDMEQQLADALDSAQFYRRRVESLQSWQSKMRDPERTIVCDIIANGVTLDPAGDRYTATLEQQAEPVSQAVIAGALFDFMGWLTTRKERLVLSSTDNASPAADAIKDFAEMRGLSLDDALVQDWQNYTTPPQQQAEPPSEWPLIKNILDEYGLQAISFVAEWKAAQQQAEPVALWQKRHPLRTENAWENTNEHDAKWWSEKAQGWEIRALYTTPPQRQWVGLTDEDVNRESAMISQKMKLAFHAGMYVAQKILKEKNSD